MNRDRGAEAGDRGRPHCGLHPDSRSVTVREPDSISPQFSQPQRGLFDVSADLLGDVATWVACRKVRLCIQKFAELGASEVGVETGGQQAHDSRHVAEPLDGGALSAQGAIVVMSPPSTPSSNFCARLTGPKDSADVAGVSCWVEEASASTGHAHSRWALTLSPVWKPLGWPIGLVRTGWQQVGQSPRSSR